jgi:hypothetical protein
MQGLELESNESKIIISIDKSIVDMDYVVRLLERLRTEYLAKKIDFNDEILELSDEVKSIWWKNNKEGFIKGTSYENHS